MSHGEVTLENCFVTNEGTVKIFNRNLISSQTSAFQHVKEGGRSVYLTPIAFEAVKKRRAKPIEDEYKADVFSLGLTLLECATFKQSSQIYDWNNFTLNLSIFSNRLLEVKERYSASFYNVLRGMLRIEEDQRFDFITLKSNLLEAGKLNPTPQIMLTVNKYIKAKLT